MKLPVSTIGKSGVICPASEDNVFISLTTIRSDLLDFFIIGNDNFAVIISTS